jgi:hypothetical protein
VARRHQTVNGYNNIAGFKDTQKKREAKKAEKAAKKATHKEVNSAGAAQEQEDGPDISLGK